MKSEGNDMIVHEDCYGKGYSLNPLEALAECRVPFPDGVFKDERDKEAVLTYCARNDALAYMHRLIAITLRGISCVYIFWTLYS